MKNLGIVGIGRWGKLLLKEFSHHSNVVVCMGTGNKKNLRWLNTKFPKIQYTTNYEDIIKNSKIDAIVIVTPIKSHYDLVKKALLSGKHVFVEKPLANNQQEAKKLLQLANKKNLIIFEGYVFTYHQIFNKLLKIFENEKLQYAKFEWKKFGSFNEDIFQNLLSHDLSMIIEFFGIPNQISYVDLKGIITDVDIVTLRLNFNQNRSCIIDLNRVSDHKKKTITFLTQQNTYIWTGDSLYQLINTSMKLKKIFQSKKQPLTIECEQFLSCLNKTNENFIPHPSLQVLKILEKIFKSEK